MDKQEYIDSTIEFLSECQRLPYQPEDNVKQTIIKDGEPTVRELRSSVRANTHFGGWEKYVAYLLNNKLIKIEQLAEMLNDTETRVKNIINCSVKNPDLELRHGVHSILGIDYYEAILTPYHSKCIDCKNKCKQNYHVNLIACKRYTKK